MRSEEEIRKLRDKLRIVCKQEPSHQIARMEQVMVCSWVDVLDWLLGDTNGETFVRSYRWAQVAWGMKLSELPAEVHNKPAG